MIFKCIKSKNYGGFGTFNQASYDYLYHKYGDELANNILKTEKGLITWNPKTQKNENIYFPAGGEEKARFSKYFIEVVEQGLEPNYTVAEGTLIVDSYDGLETSVKVVF